jgi:nicotinamidase-related amidase
VTVAVVTMELQRGVVGDLAVMPALADEVRRRGVIESTVRLLGAARAAGAPVIHCTAEFRPDRAGSAENAPMLKAVLRNPDHMLAGSPAAALVPELGPEPTDIVMARRHGVSPFAGTSLDITLRNLGIDHVVVAGVSLNIGIVGLVIEAVNHGYRVTVAEDAVAGVPPEYGEQVLQHTVRLLAKVLPADQCCNVF